MMNKKYTVLWIDDEHKKMSEFKTEAKLTDIYLDPFTTSRAGIEALIKDIDKYDAIILDARGYDESEDEAEELTGLQSSITEIAGLERKYNRKIPHFIFTGQPDLMTDSSFKSLFKNTNIYDKNKDEDVEEMFHKIKDLANDNPNFQLKHQYADVLKICSEKYIGEKHFKRVFGLIQFFESRNLDNSNKGVLLEARKVIEHLFERLNKIGVIPDEIWKSGGKLNGSSTFLSGKSTEHQYNEDILPPLVGKLLYQVLLPVQDGTHGEGELKLEVDRFLTFQDTGYFVKGVLAHLFEILVYMQDFIDAHADVEANRRMAERLINEDFVSGTVIEQAKNREKGFAFLKPNKGKINIFIPQSLVTRHGLTDGIIIEKAVIGSGLKGPELKHIIAFKEQ